MQKSYSFFYYHIEYHRLNPKKQQEDYYQARCFSQASCIFPTSYK